MHGVHSMKRFWSVILAVFATVGASGNAQTLRVRLLNGRSGKPIANGYVNVWVGHQRKEALPIPIDRNGSANLRLASNDAKVGMEGGTSDSPTFLYASEIRIQVGFVLCQVAQKKFSWLQITPYSTEDWRHTGIVTANSCGNAVAKPEPGELTIFVRPLNFWERMGE